MDAGPSTSFGNRDEQSARQRSTAAIIVDFRISSSGGMLLIQTLCACNN
jgi:hypothetical protein